MTRIKEIIIELLLCAILIVLTFWVFKYIDKPLDKTSLYVGYSLCLSAQIIGNIFNRYNKNK